MSCLLPCTSYFKWLFALVTVCCVLNFPGKAQVTEFSKRQIRKGTNPEELKVTCILNDSYDFSRFGTESGLYRYDGYNTARINTASAGIQLSSDLVPALYEDRQGSLWIATADSIRQLSPDGASIKSYLTVSGAGGGSLDGSIYFDPNKFLKPMQGPRVMLTKLVQHNGLKNKTEETTLAINSLQQIKLHYQDKFFTVYFAPKDYSELPNAQCQFAYRLAGFTHEWQHIGTANYIQLAGLPAGGYTLCIKAKGSNGIWGEELRIPVLVGKAFFLSTAAYLFYALIALGIISTIYWFQLSRIRLQNKLALAHMQMEKQEALNQLKTRLFTNITHEFRGPLTLTISPLEQLHAQPTLPVEAPLVQVVENHDGRRAFIAQGLADKYRVINLEELTAGMPGKPAEDPILLEVYRILDRELANTDFAVDQLARELAVSTRTLHRKLAALLGMNASTLIRSYRLNKAAVFLREGHTVAEAAELAGFEGLSYFSKCFKEQFSVSPSQYALSRMKQK